MWVNTMLRERSSGRPSYLITEDIEDTESILLKDHCR